MEEALKVISITLMVMSLIHGFMAVKICDVTKDLEKLKDEIKRHR